jgi:hypothetical protein
MQKVKRARLKVQVRPGDGKSRVKWQLHTGPSQTPQVTQVRFINRVPESRKPSCERRRRRTFFFRCLLLFLQFIGERYSATGQDQVICFETDARVTIRVSTKDWKAVSAALDRNQPTTNFSKGHLNYGESPLTDRSAGIGPMNGVAA